MPKKLTTEEFIKKANTVHSDKYTYEFTEYVRAHDKVIITCTIHGNFTQKAGNHINAAQGCAKCANNVTTEAEFIAKCTEVHEGYYDYSKVSYTRAHDKVTITCPIHGDFEQKAYVHLQGHNCPDCGKDNKIKKLKARENTWSFSGWEAMASTSLTFEAFTLYAIECWNSSEKFIKIGKTFNSIHRRFTKGALPYEWRVVHSETGSADYISNLEVALHRHFLSSKYIPDIAFPGYQECYNITKEDIHEFNTRTKNNS